MFNQQPQKRLWLALASEKDTDAINKLLAPKSFVILNDWEESRFTLKATLQSGEIVATARLGFATSKEKLSRHIGLTVPWNEAETVLSMTDIRAEDGTQYDNPLRLISVVFAELVGAARLVTDTPSGTGFTSNNAAQYTDLVRRYSKSAPFDWEWHGVFPFEAKLPRDFQELGSLHEFVLRTYRL